MTKDELSCEFGDDFDVPMRCTVLVMSAVALLLKKCNDGGERRWDDFFFDATKQFVGFFVGALLFSETLGLGGSAVTECDDRWLRIVLSGTFCVLVELVALSGLTVWVDRVAGEVGDFTSGVYRDYDGTFVVARYAKQLCLWLSCVFVACCAQGWFLWQFGPDLLVVSHALLATVSWSRGLELAFVSIFTPCGVGFFQVWVTDDFLQAGGCPLSELANAAVARFWPSAPLPGSWSNGPLLGRHLLNTDADDGSPGGNVKCAAPASAFTMFGGLPPAFSVPVVEQSKIEALTASPCSSAKFTTSPQRSRGIRLFSPELPEAPTAKPMASQPTAKHSDLQQALQGMECQVARALGCHPPILDTASLAVDMHADPFFAKPWTQQHPGGDEHDNWRTGGEPLVPLCRSPEHLRHEFSLATPLLDTPEMEELRSRIQAKDLLLQRLRNELTRTEETAAAAAVPERSPTPPAGFAAGHPGFCGGSSVCESPPPMMVVEQPGRFEGRPAPMEPTSEDRSLARAAFGDSPVRGDPWVAPQTKDGAKHLDGKIAALQAKIGRLSQTPGAGPGLPPRGSQR